MASRDRTPTFVRYRDSFRGTERPAVLDGIPETSKQGKRIAKQKLLDGSGDIEMGCMMAEAPPWVRTVESTVTLFDMIRTKKDELSKTMGKSKRVGFDEESEKRRREAISSLTDEISGLFKRCETNIKSVMEGLDKTDPQDLAMRKNVQSSLATQMHTLSVTFRKDQKKFFEKLKEMEAQTKYRPEKLPDDFEDTGFNQSQLADLMEAEESVEEREREIERVAEGMRDLQAIFKELAVLIIDQGTIIDRIDYNIERTAAHTGQGTAELKKAEESQRRNPATCCIMILTVVLGVLFLILVLKLMGYFQL
mmetsp:Transcript_40224/g.95501  ORF Transcript_40224/g.95501 Transcript_40224/m.95501 type:complete len:308 (-) Transcript_40224:108-1031(-)